MNFTVIFHPTKNNASLSRNEYENENINWFLKALTVDGTNSHINNKPFNFARGIAILFLTGNNHDLLIKIEHLFFQDL